MIAIDLSKQQVRDADLNAKKKKKKKKILLEIQLAMEICFSLLKEQKKPF